MKLKGQGTGAIRGQRVLIWAQQRAFGKLVFLKWGKGQRRKTFVKQQMSWADLKSIMGKEGGNGRVVEGMFSKLSWELYQLYYRESYSFKRDQRFCLLTVIT